MVALLDRLGPSSWGDRQERQREREGPYQVHQERGHQGKPLEVQTRLAWAVHDRLGASSCRGRGHLHRGRDPQVLVAPVQGQEEPFLFQQLVQHRDLE